MAGYTNHQKMEKTLVVFDIDGTIDRTPTTDLLVVLNDFSRRGFVFGINTNRPFSESIGYYESLRMKGPLVTEDGSTFRASRGALEETAFGGLIPLNETVARILAEACGRSDDLRAHFLWSDDKTLISLHNYGRVILVTKARRFTTSVYVREMGVVSDAFTGEVLRRIVSGLGSLNSGARLIADETGGKIIGSNIGADRLNTLFRIVGKRYPEARILAISDDEPKKDDVPPGVTFAAVKTAALAYKSKCSIVATKEGAKGIRQILDEFCRIELL